MKLAGKVAVITGGASGIGLAIASRFTKEGAKVVIADYSERLFAAVRKKLPGASLIKADVSREADVQKVISQTIKKHKRLDILVNNAGIALEENFPKTSLVNFERIMATNFRGVFLFTKHALPHLLKTRGKVINVASKVAFVADPDVPIYSASKAAVLMFTKSTALALARKGVRVNCVCPGPIDTPLLQTWFKSRREMLDYYAKNNPMGRLGRPEEVANIVLFLASDENPFVTGAVYTVDGGD